MIIALAILAIGDLVVGVSNDAVNFLNSALGSKAISVRNIMILASLGVAVGAVFSSGMMEVARKGIFNPAVFYFDEIIVTCMYYIFAYGQKASRSQSKQKKVKKDSSTSNV